MSLIKVDNLSFGYDQNLVLKNVSFEIKKGSYVTIIGHNGSGKSTLARLLLGLLEKKSGKIVIDGLELNERNLETIRKKIGIVFQNPDNQFIGSTVEDDIAFGLENICVDHKKMDDLILKFATKVGMQNYLKKEPHNLSGGQKQRVAIAGVLAMSPEIIVFDEATSMLDPKGKMNIKKLISDLHKNDQQTIISITHDVEEVLNSDFVIVLNQGKIFKMDIPESIFKNEQALIDIDLDVPFLIKFKNILKKQGIRLSDSFDNEKVIEELCQLKSKI